MNLDAIFAADTLWRAVIFAITVVCLAVVRAWQWREAERIKLQRAVARAGLEDNRKPIFDADPPEDPPRIGPVLALLLSLGAIEGYTAVRAQAMAKHPTLAPPRQEDWLCWPPCQKGEVCEGKTCTRSAETETGLKPGPTSQYDSPVATYSDGRDPFEMAPRL